MAPFHALSLPTRAGPPITADLTLPGVGACMAVQTQAALNLSLGAFAALALCWPGRHTIKMGTLAVCQGNAAALGERACDLLVGAGCDPNAVQAAGLLCLARISEHLESLGLQEVADAVPTSAPTLGA